MAWLFLMGGLAMAQGVVPPADKGKVSIQVSQSTGFPVLEGGKTKVDGTPQAGTLQSAGENHLLLIKWEGPVPATASEEGLLKMVRATLDNGQQSSGQPGSVDVSSIQATPLADGHLAVTGVGFLGSGISSKTRLTMVICPETARLYTLMSLGNEDAARDAVHREAVAELECHGHGAMSW